MQTCLPGLSTDSLQFIRLWSQGVGAVTEPKRPQAQCANADAPPWTGQWPPSGQLDVGLKQLSSDSTLRPLIGLLLPASGPSSQPGPSGVPVAVLGSHENKLYHGMSSRPRQAPRK